MRLVLAAAFGCSFILGLVLVVLMRRVSPALGLVDHPGGRKAHARPTPLGGGIAILLAALLPLLAAGALAWAWRGQPAALTSSAVLQANIRLAAERFPLLLGILAGGLAFGALGTWDDLKDLSPAVKLAGQVLIALAVSMIPQVRVSLFIHSTVAQVAITTVWIVLLANCFNLLDNMDGQSGLMAFLCGGALLVVALQTGQNFIAGMLMALLGAVLGFLFFNLPPASIFMGDGGAMFIGYMLAVSTSLSNFLTARQVNPLFPVVVPLVIFAVPLYDTLSVIAIRLHTRAPHHEGGPQPLRAPAAAAGDERADGAADDGADRGGDGGGGHAALRVGHVARVRAGGADGGGAVSSSCCWSWPARGCRGPAPRVGRSRARSASVDLAGTLQQDGERRLGPVLHLLADLEADDGLGWDFHHLVGAGVAGLARGLQAGVEDAEVAELHPVTFGELCNDLIEELLDHFLGHDLRVAGLLRDPLAQLSLGNSPVVHSAYPFQAARRTAAGNRCSG